MTTNTLSETEREVLAELVESPGWLLLWEKIMPPALQQVTHTVFNEIRVENNLQATRYVGKYEGAVSVAVAVYQAIKQQPPDFLRALQKGVTDGRPD